MLSVICNDMPSLSGKISNIHVGRFCFVCCFVFFRPKTLAKIG